VPPFYIRGFMAVYDFRKAQKGVSGQKIVSLGANNNDLEKRVSGLEDKLDTILTLLNKEANNDKNRPKPVSGDDSGV
jgi:cell division protein FtsB